jgi:hypothetical protein
MNKSKVTIIHQMQVLNPLVEVSSTTRGKWTTSWVGMLNSITLA